MMRRAGYAIGLMPLMYARSQRQIDSRTATASCRRLGLFFIPRSRKSGHESHSDSAHVRIE